MVKHFLFTVLLLTASAQGLAQSDPFLGGNFSVRIPFDGRDATLIALGAQGGDYHLFGPLGLRGRLGLGLSPSVYADLGADLIFPFSEGVLSFYGGTGVSLVTGGVLNTAFGLHVLAGLEGLLPNSKVGLFGELQPNVAFPRGTALFNLRLNFGVNYHF